MLQGQKQPIEGAGEKTDVASSVASTNDVSSSIGSTASEFPLIPKIGTISEADSVLMDDPFLNCVLSLKCLLGLCVTDSLPMLHSKPLDAPELQYRSSAAFLSNLLTEFWETPVQRLLLNRKKAGGSATYSKDSASKVFLCLFRSD